MPAKLENSAVATGLEKVSFHSNPKERQCQRILKLLHNCTCLTARDELDTTEWLHFPFSLLFIGERNGNPLQCSCLENPRDGGAWWTAIYGVAQNRTWLKRLSSSSSSRKLLNWSTFCCRIFFFCHRYPPILIQIMNMLCFPCWTGYTPWAGAQLAITSTAYLACTKSLSCGLWFLARALLWREL